MILIYRRVNFVYHFFLCTNFSFNFFTQVKLKLRMLNKGVKKAKEGITIFNSENMNKGSHIEIFRPVTLIGAMLKVLDVSTHS